MPASHNMRYSENISLLPPMKRSQTLPENNTEHEHPNQRFGTLRSQSQEDFDSRGAGVRLRKNAVEREVSGDKEQISR